ncbi:MAG: cyclomaltodextrinase N-terminal domain-containing protein [Acidobacteria bacterium]|nr:cyclomaltodextrinase N-terminal domain-containing protein [Acidobacteriota bacterium]
MSHRTIQALAVLGILAAGPMAVVPATAQDGPAVLKVDPPSWWTGSTLNPVRLLVRGRNLAGARVETGSGSGLEVGLASVNSRGSFLFVDVHVDPSAAPGPRALTVRTAGGDAEIPFEVLSPLPRSGRFQGFGPDDVLYLAMPDRFANGDISNDDPAKAPGLLDRARGRYYHGGDLRGVIDKLPYLVDLGITALWLNPWYDNNDALNEVETYDGQAITDYHGYGAVDFYAVDEHLGDLETLRELVDAAHAVGIKIIQDQVANHSGPYHPWVGDAPTPTWYYGTKDDHLANTWQTWTLQDPSATPQMQKATLEGWFLDILPDLDQDDPEVARYIIQNTLWWVGVTGLDGIRQDTLPYVHRRFWREWMAAIKREFPDLRVVGELFDGDPALVSFFQTGATRFDGIDSGIDTAFDFPLYFKIRDAFAGEGTLREAAKVVARDHLYPDASVLVTFLGLHDVARFMNEPQASPASLRAAYTLLTTVRGSPLVYYGDEIAMPGGGDPDNRRDFPGGWPDDPRNAFAASGRTAPEEEVFAHLRRLLHLRRDLEPLRRGRMVNLAVNEESWVYARVLGGEVAVVALNADEAPATIEAPVAPVGWADGTVLDDRLGSGVVLVVDDGRLRLTLPPMASAVFTVP